MSSNVTATRKVLMLVTISSFVLLIALNASIGVQFTPKLAGVLAEMIDAAPRTVTIAVWGVLYVLQGTWLTLLATHVVKGKDPDLLPMKIYILYALSLAFNALWLTGMMFF